MQRNVFQMTSSDDEESSVESDPLNSTDEFLEAFSRVGEEKETIESDPPNNTDYFLEEFNRVIAESEIRLSNHAGDWGLK